MIAKNRTKMTPLSGKIPKFWFSKIRRTTANY